MTTITWRRNEPVAYDDQATSGNLIYKANKEFRFRVHKSKKTAMQIYCFSSGNLIASQKMISWIVNSLFDEETFSNFPLDQIGIPISKETIDKFPELGENEASILMIVESKNSSDAYLFDSDYHAEFILDDIVALGTGNQLAIGAMASGKSTTEAVYIASQYDAYTSNNIFSTDTKTGKTEKWKPNE